MRPVKQLPLSFGAGRGLSPFKKKCVVIVLL